MEITKMLKTRKNLLKDRLKVLQNHAKIVNERKVERDEKEEQKMILQRTEFIRKSEIEEEENRDVFNDGNVAQAKKDLAFKMRQKIPKAQIDEILNDLERDELFFFNDSYKEFDDSVKARGRINIVTYKSMLSKFIAKNAIITGDIDAKGQAELNSLDSTQWRKNMLENSSFLTNNNKKLLREKVNKILNDFPELNITLNGVDFATMINDDKFRVRDVKEYVEAITEPIKEAKRQAKILKDQQEARENAGTKIKKNLIKSQIKKKGKQEAIDILNKRSTNVLENDDGLVTGMESDTEYDPNADYDDIFSILFSAPSTLNKYKKGDLYSFFTVFLSRAPAFDVTHDGVQLSSYLNNPVESTTAKVFVEYGKLIKKQNNEQEMKPLKDKEADRIKNLKFDPLDYNTTLEYFYMVDAVTFTQSAGSKLNVATFLNALINKQSQYDVELNDVLLSTYLEKNIKDFRQNIFQQYINLIKQKGPPKAMTGKGINRNRKNMYGTGSATPTQQYEDIGKFEVNMYKLMRNILSVSYKSCRHKYIMNIGPIHDNSVILIKQMINNENFDLSLYNTLPEDDQIMLETFSQKIKYPAQIQSQSTVDLKTNYAVLKGQYEAGNDNPAIKNSLKKHIHQMYTLNLIPKNQYMASIYSLTV